MAIDLKPYPQCDQKDWSNKTLGYGPTTIGAEGAVVCSLAAILHRPPNEVNDTMLAADAFDGAKLILADLPYDKVFGGRLRLVKQSKTYEERAMPDGEIDELRGHVRAGRPAIVRVNVAKDRDNYLAVSEIASDGNIVVWDPWYADTKPVTERYCKPPGKPPSKTPGEAIIRFDLFELREEGGIEDEIVVPKVTLRPPVSGQAVRDLQNCLNALGFHVPAGELSTQWFGVGTQASLRKFQAVYGVSSSGIFDEATLSALTRAIEVARWKQNRIEGRIFLERGQPAVNLPVWLYHRDTNGELDLLVNGQTDGEGFYALSYASPSDGVPNLEVHTQVKKAKGEIEEVLLSTTLFGATKYQTLNLVAPSSIQPLEPEYVRLRADLDKQLGDPTKLAGLQENAERRDLTLLHQATGWDARLIGLAATAAKLAAYMQPVQDLNAAHVLLPASAPADTQLVLDQDAVYGLLRAGFPSDKSLLAQVDAGAAEQALKKVRDVGIVQLTDEQIGLFKQKFATFSSEEKLNRATPGSRSTYRELLKASGLTDDAQDKFAAVYLSHGGDTAKMWEEARKAGIEDLAIGKLQLQGKLAFLTTNSVKLTTRLQASIDTSDPVQLIEKDLHRADSWIDEIDSSVDIPAERRDNLTDADKKALGALIPPAFAGETVEARRSLWAEDMARKVRVSYPTQVVARMLETNELTLPAAQATTSTLLKSAARQGFRLGQTPVESFFQTHAGVTLGIPEAEVEAGKQQMKTLHCVYQITPSNEAMSALLELGLTSAHDFTAISEDVFVDMYGKKFPSIIQARKVHQKARQVSSVTYNLCAIALNLFQETQPAVTTAPAKVQESVKNELIKHFPTMESLFGSMDFCDCEHCRSVLSPAAYLVDLLYFIDRGQDEAWGGFLGKWEEKNKEKYSAKYKKPYEALIERRPDLPHIPLTCENTNTALPYIDIVNEIMEYYVAHNQLTADAAHDTGEATTAELLAEPQNVIAEAYDKLHDARYPLTLPFDLWLETVRQFCDYFEMPLARILEVFRLSDDLFVKTQPFDRSSIFIESLGISASEWAIFADPDPLAKWHELYGFKSPAEAITEATDADTRQRIDLNSAKALSRRLGISYKELVEVIQTGFVNPKLGELAILYKLGVSIHDAHFYQEHIGLLQQDPEKLTKEEQTQRQEVEAFAKRLKELGDRFNMLPVQLEGELQAMPFDQILVLADPNTGCNFDETTLQYASGAAAQGIDFLKINLFVRLWRKLGWTIEEIDRALQTFVPKNAPFEAGHLDKQPLQTALIYLAHLKTIDEKLRLGKQSRLKLLTMWSDIATKGKKPLYAQLYLNRGVLKSGEVEIVTNGQTSHRSVFDDPLGRYLQPAILAAMAAQVRFEVSLRNVSAANKINEAAFAGNHRVAVRYDPDSEVQYLSYVGVLSDPDKAQLAALAPSALLTELLDAVQVAGQEFMLIKGHVLALQGALGLTADEIGRILDDAALDDAGKSLAKAELSLPNVSLLYRYGMLARALKLSVRDLIALKQLSNLDPFRLLHLDPLATSVEDYPFSQTLRFLEVVEEVKASGLTVEDLEYLLRHRFDETGKYRPNGDAVLALLKTLAEGIRAIRAEYAVPDDPAAMSDDVLRQKLGLILPADVVERLLAMLNGTVEFTVTKAGVATQDQLYASSFVGELAISRVAYNAAKQEQELVMRGVLFDAHKTQLKDKYSIELTAGQQATFATLLDDVQVKARKEAEEFFVKHLQKQPISTAATTGFLDLADFDILFELNPTLGLGETEQDRLRTRRARLTNAFLPFLQDRLIRQFIVQTMTAQTGGDPVLVESMLTDNRLLGEVQPGEALPLLEVLTAVGGRGLTATFFDNAGKTLKTANLTDADTSLKDEANNPIKPAGTDRAKFEGYLEVPTPGVYRFYAVMGKQNAKVELRFAHLTKAILTDAANHDGEELGNGPDEYAELKPGILYRFTLDLDKLNGGDARVLVQGETRAKDSLAQLVLYPLQAVEGAERSIGLLTKTLQLLQSCGLSEREVRYLLTHTQAGEFEGLDLKKLPTLANDDTLNGAQALFAQFLRLAAYARLKRDLASGTDDLIAVFEANGTGDLKKVYPLIAKLTRRDDTTIQATTKALFDKPSFSSEKPLMRLWEALQVVDRCGVPVAAIVEWTRIVNATAPSGQRFAIARDLKETVKARFEPETWLRVAQPIFDKLRQRQRDALAAYIMQQQKFARMEELYEYFLIDPSMEPVVETSRIRLAISSVQLFVQRCLLNLERSVHPSAIINADQWEWMKRYRVWEANRKIFLFPENWLEPEFRDDKTPLFRELEGALLQGDVSSDLVEDAFLNYLKKLDELARLDIVAMHLENKPDWTQNTLHVFGRTFSQPHKYFYRRYAHEMWTPWEPVTAETEGDHLAPVVWRDRLYLFWVTFMEKAQPSNQSITVDLKTPITIPTAPPKKKVEVQLHWSEYIQGEWTTRQSSQFIPAGIYWPEWLYRMYADSIGYHLGIPLPGWYYAPNRDDLMYSPLTVSFDFDPRSVFVHVSKEPGESGEERGVYINLGSPDISQTFYLASRNSPPEAATANDARRIPYSPTTKQVTRYWDTGRLDVKFVERTGGESSKEPKLQTVLQKGGAFTLLPCDNDIATPKAQEDAYKYADDPVAVKAAIESSLGDIISLMKPVFYQDRDHTLFVEPDVTERTIETWKEWAPPVAIIQPSMIGEDWWDKPDIVPEIPDLEVMPEFPNKPIPPEEDWSLPIDPESVIRPEKTQDWLCNPETTLLFNNELIGPKGGAGLQVLPEAEFVGSAMGDVMHVSINGGNLAAGSVVIHAGATTLEELGLKQMAGGLNVISSAGFTAALAKKTSEFGRSGFGANTPRLARD